MGKERDRGRERRRVQQTETEQTAPHLSVTYSVDTDIKTVVILWYAVDMAVYRLFSGLFLLRAISWCGENCKKKNWHMNTHTGHASRVASLVGLLFSKFYSVTTFFFFLPQGAVFLFDCCVCMLCGLPCWNINAQLAMTEVAAVHDLVWMRPYVFSLFTATQLCHSNVFNLF